ncbi:N-acetylmuramoyl-L-alanine amidase [Nocardia veterana]|uniref:N-acetylmuramoyl-L-alanine amidase n=1 Tax=Nocardia veterana TaxID=132249 RepID=UPI0002F0BB6C
MNHPRIIKTGLRLAVAACTTAGVLVPAAAFAAPAAPADPDMSTKLAGKTVFLDPGHQGTNHSEDLNRQVDNGRGGTKECQTTGMTTRNGIAEHTVNWNVAQLVRQSLEALGAHVVLSRQDDTGWGGCIDERAAAANRSGAAVAVSIHADGAPEQDHGFHLIVPQLPIPDVKANQAQSGPGLAATKSVRDAYVQAGFTPANYAGAVDGLQTRSDVAGPALTEVPDVFIEMGNGANVDDAKLLETPDGQLKHAIAITTGLVGYLIGVAPGTSPAASTPADSPAGAPQAVPAPESPAPNAAQNSTSSAPPTPPLARGRTRCRVRRTVPCRARRRTPLRACRRIRHRQGRRRRPPQRPVRLFRNRIRPPTPCAAPRLPVIPGRRHRRRRRRGRIRRPPRMRRTGPRRERIRTAIRAHPGWRRGPRPHRVHTDRPHPARPGRERRASPERVRGPVNSPPRRCSCCFRWRNRSAWTRAR